MLDRYRLSIGPADSVPMKPTGRLFRIVPAILHSQSRQPKSRNAYALIAVAAACGITNEDGARIPRRFTYLGADTIVENGVARDILKAGLASSQAASDPKNEMFVLDGKQARAIIGLPRCRTLDARGLVSRSRCIGHAEPIRPEECGSAHPSWKFERPECNACRN